MIQQIKVRPNYPKQTITFSANNQNFTLNMYWTGYQSNTGIINNYMIPAYFDDLFLGPETIITGTPVIDRTPINIYGSNINGYIMTVDSQGNSNPNLDNFGDTVFLYYLDNLSELDSLAVT